MVIQINKGQGQLDYQAGKRFFEGEGFKMNPYDPCCFTKTINGSSCTLLFYVDNIYASHKEELKST